MLTLFAQRGGGDPAAAGGMMACFGTFAIVMLIFVVVAFAILWKVFTKAGQPGWAALVPIYNHYILVIEVCKLEILWFILGFIPIGNIIAGWVVCQALAKKFGKSDAFGIGLFFLGPIFLAILAFGDARYQGRGGRSMDDDDYDDRPRKRSRDYDDEDEEEDERPRKKKRRLDDDDD